MSREYTNKLIELMQEGIILPDSVVAACLKYMSEDEVKDMAISNEFICEEEED